ncbi:hypothetical protein NMY22_g11587 [Coprinellus aureogranulatus]|nr:hypothetical protein NMY22_g11587 [Coprinellus aureogranulatus]
MMDSTDTITDPINTAERHGVYYWDFVTFRVGDCLFRVPLHPFVLGSASFAEKHGLSSKKDDYNQPDSPGDTPGRRRSDPIPIVLNDVTVSEFELFLHLVLPQFNCQLESSTKPKDFSTCEWLTILKLSTAWHFIRVRKLAIEELTSRITDPIELVAAAREYGVSHWLVSAYEMLVKRSEIMTEEEGAKLGIHVAFKLCILREGFIRNKAAASPLAKKPDSSCYCKNTCTCRPASPPPALNTWSHIRTSFKNELSIVTKREKEFQTKEEKEADERAQREREKRDEEERMVKDEEGKKEELKREVEEARTRLAAAEEEHRLREEQLQTERRELEKKAESLQHEESVSVISKHSSNVAAAITPEGVRSPFVSTSKPKSGKRGLW